MLCPNCGKPTEESFAALCPECKEVKEQAKREAEEKLRAEQEKKRGASMPVAPKAVGSASETKAQSPSVVITEPAGFWLRLLAWSVDAVALTVIAYLWVFVIFQIAGLTFSIEKMLVDRPSLYLKTLGNLEPVAIVGILLIALLTPSLLEASKWQATLGKKLLGLKVITKDNQRPSIGKCLVRTIGRGFMHLLAGILFLGIAFHSEKKGLHDIATGTRVMKTENNNWLRVCWAMMIVLVHLLVSSFFDTSQQLENNTAGGSPTITTSTYKGEIDENYSSEEVPQLGTYTLERYQKLTLKLSSPTPMKLSYTHPKNFDNSRCKDQCAKISVIGEAAKVTTEWIGMNKAGQADPVGGNISVELQNLTDRSLEVILHGEVLD